MRFSPTLVTIASSLGAAALGVLIQSIVWTANNGAAALTLFVPCDADKKVKQ